MRKENSFLILALLFIFAAVEFRGLFHIDNSDENIYFYMSSLVAQGNIPYRDFFYAHPPLELVYGGIVFKLFGFSLFLLKLLPLASALVSAYFIFKISKNHFSESAAIFSAAFFLTSYRVILEATYFTGVQLAVMFMLIGIYFIHKRPYLAGLFFSLACLTRLLVIVPIACVILFMLIKNFKSFAQSAGSFLAVFGSANILLFALFPSFLLSVYKFHLLKLESAGTKLFSFTQFFSQNILLILGVGLVFMFWNKRLAMFSFALGGFLVFLLFLGKIFSFYFLAAIPFMAIMSGVTLDFILSKAKSQKIGLMIICAIFIIAFGLSVQRLWFFDFAEFSTAPRISSVISQVEGDLFGDATSTPLVALLSGKKIANNLVDTNEQVYLSGIRNLQAELEESNPKLIILNRGAGISMLDETEKYVLENCILLREFKDEYWGDFLVFRCSQG